MTPIDELLTVAVASQALGFTVQYTRFLIRNNKLPAKKFGRDWVIERRAIENLRQQKGRQNG